MKSVFARIFSHPKIIIPIFLVIAGVGGVFLFRTIGQVPSVSLSPDPDITPSATENTAQEFDLAFPITGRVANVSVSVGDQVTKGETLATLDAGAAQGAVTQAKGALELAQAQHGSMNVQYTNAKQQQDVLVENAYRTLLSNNLAAVPSVIDDSHIPSVSGTYTCDTEGDYDIVPYASSASSGYSFAYKGLESGNGIVTFSTPQPLGSCGLYIQFVPGFSGATMWTISIPNEKSSTYVTNKNAYDLAVSTREQTLSQLAANLGKTASGADTTQAAIDAAQGAYQAALGAYQNNLIVAPTDGTVTFIDTDLKVGQSVTPNKTVISITTQ